jgi:hypothetical protein
MNGSLNMERLNCKQEKGSYCAWEDIRSIGKAVDNLQRSCSKCKEGIDFGKTEQSRVLLREVLTTRFGVNSVVSGRS